jgi:hypothetical protein
MATFNGWSGLAVKRASHLVAGAFCALVVAWGAAGAGAVEIVEQTQVAGTLPLDLRGVWLVVPTVEFPNSKRALAWIYEIGGEPGAPRFRLVQKNLPGRLGKALEAAQAAEQTWEPSAADLRELARRWEDLAPPTDEVSSASYRVAGPDGYDDALKKDESTAGSSFAIVVTEMYVPRPNHTSQSVFSYGARELSPDLITGSHVQGTVIAAPFPIPLSFKGTFRMYRIAPAERDWRWKVRLLLTGLTDGLRGCAVGG